MGKPTKLAELMELRAFVKETLTQVMSGVSEAQQAVHDEQNGGEICPPIGTNWEAAGFVFSKLGQPVQQVEFDVAVTASEISGTKGTIGVLLGAFGFGMKGQSESGSGQNSRIKFSVPVSLPVMPNWPKQTS